MKSFSRINQNHINIFALVLMTLFCLCFFLHYLSLSFDLDNYYIFPLIILVLTTLLFAWPFKHFYSSYRFEIFFSMLKSCFPFGNYINLIIGPYGVTYRDFIIAECLISLSVPFQSFQKAVCLFTCTKCREYNVSDGCSMLNGYFSLFISAFPYFIRILQCYNKYYYTGRNIFVMNMVKNLFGIILSISLWLYVNDHISATTFLISFFIKKTSFLLWDFIIDWNLFKLSSKNFLLRDILIFPIHWYYLAILLNIIGRGSLLLSFYGMDQNFIIMLMSIITMGRRVVWVILRFESEFTNNIEGYRKFMYMPSLPMLK